MGDILCAESHSAFVGVCNAEHDAQLQLPHEVIAAVTFEDVLPRLGQNSLYVLVLVLLGLVLFDSLPVT